MRNGQVVIVRVLGAGKERNDAAVKGASFTCQRSDLGYLHFDSTKGVFILTHSGWKRTRDTRAMDGMPFLGCETNAYGNQILILLFQNRLSSAWPRLLPQLIFGWAEEGADVRFFLF